MISRTLSSFALISALGIPFTAHAAQAVIDVYKTSSCGCCKAWVTHLEKNGFKVRAHDVEDPGVVRKRGGISDEHASCHTAKVGKYTVEGHVPAADIKRLLLTKPNADGLAVPGMPMGSPGMEGGRSDAYDVLIVKNGRASVFNSYR